MSQEERNEVGSQRNILRFLLEHITVSFLGAKNIEGLKIRTNDHYFVWPHIPNLVDLYVSHLLGKLLKGSSDARTLFFNDSGLESLLIIFKVFLRIFSILIYIYIYMHVLNSLNRNDRSISMYFNVI